MLELYESFDRLVDFARRKLMLADKDVDYARNTAQGVLGVAFAPTGVECGERGIAELLSEFTDNAVRLGVFEREDAERYCDGVMGALSLSPSALQAAFDAAEKAGGGKAATDMLYAYCVNNNYVKKAQLDKNPRFESNGLIITINKSKPEFRDAKKAAAGNSVGGGYPSCTICHANEGFGGRGKRTLRTADVTLGGQPWFWQYSPYGYFNEHGIAVNYEHTPMHIDRGTFGRLMDFVDRFPHYFLGCNAALPRIGGSVLAHDHYQGGGETLPLHRAAAKRTIKDTASGAIIEVLDWAGTAVRVVSNSRADIESASERVRAAWESFDAPELGIIHADADGIHNSISPTVVKTKRGYEMTIILRSNITSAQYPDGVFHAHPEFHVIKKESIGLIEAQGLFILPGRLESELGEIKECIVGGKGLPESLADYAFVYGEILRLLDGKTDAAAAENAIRVELGSICSRILQNTAVFKDDALTVKFIKEKVL